MKTGFSLWELAHREFPVSYTGFGFAVYLVAKNKQKQISSSFQITGQSSPYEMITQIRRDYFKYL